MKVGHLPLDKDQKNSILRRVGLYMLWYDSCLLYDIRSAILRTHLLLKIFKKSQHTPKTQFGQSPVGEQWKGCLFSRVLVTGCLGCVPVRCVGSQPENLTPKMTGEEPKTPISSSRDFPRKFMETPTMAPWHGNSPPPWRLSLLLGVYNFLDEAKSPNNLPLGEPPKNKCHRGKEWEIVVFCFFSCSCWPVGYHKTWKRCLGPGL